MKKILFSMLLVFSPAILISERISYVVNFEGLEDHGTLEALKSASQLISLQKKKPSSPQALRFRAESDFPALLKTLQNYGYLEATLNLKLEKLQNRYLVNIEITPGPRYQIETYKALTDVNLPLSLEGPLIAQKILDADLKLLKLLSEKAYPFASIKNREIIADGEKKTAQVVVEVDKGPLAYFGPTSIQGLKNVRPQFVENKLQWEEKELFNSRTVNETQKELMDSGLFSSVYITPQTQGESQSLPMNVEVVESKQKSISVAASYQMTYGPGLTFAWENRNLGGMGRKLSLSVDIAQHTHSGTAALVSPDFIRPGQDFKLQAEASSEEITAFQDRSYNLLIQLERGLSDSIKGSIGLKPESLIVTESVENGTFYLLQLPFSLKYSGADSSLNATKGTTFEYQLTAAVSFKEKPLPYFAQNFTYCNYLPLLKKDTLVLAQKVSLQSIFSSSLEIVPVPKRILGGSEDNLRGYRFLTVSPLNDESVPIGGRSAIYYSLEPRFRVSESIGIVPFFDFGNVFATPLPDFKGKWLKSLGMGFRYFSFFGPLRLDLAFPLDRRKDLDPKWWIFANVGQSF